MIKPAKRYGEFVAIITTVLAYHKKHHTCKVKCQMRMGLAYWKGGGGGSGEGETRGRGLNLILCISTQRRMRFKPLDL